MSTWIPSRFAAALLAVSISFFFNSVQAFGQATALGQIVGTVLDSSGAAVPGATVKVTNQETGVMREVTTNDQGNYAVPSLVRGLYRVEVSAPSFGPQAQSDLRLDIGGSIKIDFELKVGTVAEAVEVRAAADLLQATEGTIATTVENTQVREMPLNGRSYLNLIRLTPGATRGSIGTGPTLNGTNFSVTGSRSDNSNYTFDGTFNNGTFFKTGGITPSIDAIAEFRIQTNMSAKYGAAAGANINVASRSGSNDLHFSLFEFFRHDKMDSRDYFAARRPHYRQSPFGGSVGGPVLIPKL